MQHPNHTIRLHSNHVYVISDLHLGDGTRSDAFCLGDSMTKRDLLRNLIQEVRSNDGYLVINGDLMDLQQGWSIDRVITANAIVFRELSDLGREGKLIYIWSELDSDLSYFEELLGAQTASSVEILSEPDEVVTENHPTSAPTTSEQTAPFEPEQGSDQDSQIASTDDAESIENNPEDIEKHQTTERQPTTNPTAPVWATITQGFRFNPMLQGDTLPSLKVKSAHHLVERLLGTWIRFPLENFPTLENRLFFWLLHKLHWLGQQLGTENSLGAKIGHTTSQAYANQIGDPNQVWRELHRQIEEGTFVPKHQLLILGHSHLPGVAPLQNNSSTLINTGSWIFDSQTVLHLDTTAQAYTLCDWQSKETIDSAPYAHLFSQHPTDIAQKQNNFSHWWKQHYQGWLRFTF